MVKRFELSTSLSRRIKVFTEQNKVQVNMPKLSLDEAETWLLNNMEELLRAQKIATNAIWENFGDEIEQEAIEQYPCNYPVYSINDLHKFVRDAIRGEVSTYARVKLNLK